MRTNRAIDRARANADELGVSDLVFTRCDLASLVLPNAEVRGLLISNPPYGERLGEQSSLVFSTASWVIS